MDLTEEFSEFIAKSELAQEFRKKQRNDLELKRAAAIDARTPAEKEKNTIALQITDVKNNLMAGLRRLDEEKKTLEQRAGDQIIPLLNRSHELDNEIKTNNAFLLTHYEREIDDAISFFMEKQTEAMHTPASRMHTIGNRKLSGSAQVFIRSNYPAILKLIEHCRAAIKELEAMKLNVAACDHERIEMLKAGLPDMREMSETVAWVETPSILGAIFNC